MSDTPGGGPSRPEPSRESISEVARWYLSTWTAPEHGWRGTLGHVAFLAGVTTAAAIAGEGSWADVLSRHPLAALSIAACLLAWCWLEIVPELRGEPPVRRVLAGAQLLVLVGVLLVAGPPDPLGQAWARAAWAAALLCLVALSFRRSWSWAVAAALVAAAAGWILWGGGGSGPG